jgi:hypothetical protein
MGSTTIPARSSLPALRGATLGLAVAALTASGAHALTLNAQDSIYLDNLPQATSGASPGITDSMDVEIADSPSSSNNDSSGFVHTYGDDQGVFGARASGSGSAGGSWDVLTTFTLDQTITNNTGIAQTYVLNFLVDGGEVSTNGTPGTGGFLTGEFKINITFGATQIATDVNVSTDPSGSSTILTSGFSLDGTIGASSYTWNPIVESVVLGTLDPGDSADLTYLMTSIADGTLGSDASCSSGIVAVEEEVGEGINAGGGGSCSSIARSGDPIQGDGAAPGTVGTFDVQAAPEPGSVTLLGAALVGLGVMRRRRRRGAAAHIAM